MNDMNPFFGFVNLMEAQDDFFCQSFLHHSMRHYLFFYKQEHY
jgi:hypothetical protein